MKAIAPRLAAVIGLLFASALKAQVPQLINYQGRVAVNGVNFNGTGQFKFALVNSGSGGTVSYWSNDGASAAGSQPAVSVTLTVTKGLYSVLLGDASLQGMSVIPGAVFNNSDVRLRVWFNDGTNGFQLLTPDQRIAAVGYAMMAGNVPDGAISGAKLAPGAAAANLNASGQSGVASGGLILSATQNPALLSAGYLRIGATTLPDAWLEQNGGMPPAARYLHNTVWTGSEMIIWGGVGAGVGNNGGRYGPAANLWTPVNGSGALPPRQSHTAVWTGSEMIVWGGAVFDTVTLQVTYLNSGARYHPGTGSWTAMNTAGAPGGRTGHTAVSTGSEMIVWGGTDGGYLNDGARYHPASDSWSSLSLPGSPAPRSEHTAVWAGDQMIVWGGKNVAGRLGTGGRYLPSSNQWLTVNTTGAPTARTGHTANWTGGGMIVWGGTGGAELSDGARYEPAANAWSPLSAAGAPAARRNHTAVWTGSELIVWGGASGAFVQYHNDGGCYRPANNTWTATDLPGAPAGRAFHSAIWTGREMIVWGGITNSSAVFNDTFSYTPARVMHLYQRP